MSRGTTKKSTPPDILSAAYLEGASGKKVRTAAAASCRSNDAGKDIMTHVRRNNDMVLRVVFVVAATVGGDGGGWVSSMGDNNLSIPPTPPVSYLDSRPEFIK